MTYILYTPDIDVHGNIAIAIYGITLFQDLSEVGEICL